MKYAKYLPGLSDCHAPINVQGRMAEWSKALVLGTSHFGGAGSNPVPVIIMHNEVNEPETVCPSHHM